MTRRLAAFAALLLAPLAPFAAPGAALAVPPEVAGVAWCAAQKNCLQWTPAAGAQTYRVYRGETATLPCALTPSPDSCLNGVFAAPTTGSTLVEVPAAGSMFWFLVTALDGNGEGSPGAGTAGARTLDATGACAAAACAPAGTACAVDDECCTGTCSGGTCQAGCCAPAGAACSTGAECCGGTCEGGTCRAQCLLGTDCPGSDTECATRTCVEGICGVDFAAAGLPLGAQTPGDCQLAVCDGAGNAGAQPDDGDAPDDGNQCTNDACSGGAPVFDPLPTGATCSQGGGFVCDGTGRCVECVSASECPGADTECAYRTCAAGQCGYFTAPAGSQAGTQTTGDCRVDVCDGNGGVVSQADDTDVPFDGQECTFDTCMNGVPAFLPAPIDSPCAQDGGVVCNESGQCVACNSAAQCPGEDGQCASRTCSGNACGMGFAPSGTACDENGGSACDGAGTCVGLPQVASTSPGDGSTSIVAAAVAVTFTHPMNPATLTAQTLAGPCSGSIQLSLDDFASCVAFSAAAPAMSAGDTVATLTPAPGLSVVRVYKVRVTTAAQSATGVPLSAPYTHLNGFTTQSPNLCDGSLVISQAYGEGGLAGASYRNDFVELHNRGTSAVSVTGMSLQYAAATGTAWARTNLSGTIQPGGFYLVQLASGGAVGASLPAPDAAGTTDISSAGGKLALVSNQVTLTGGCPLGGAVLDLVGYGGANCSEGGTSAPGGSNTESVTRQRTGCADVGANHLDFLRGTPAARNSASSAQVCGCYVHNELGVTGEADWCAVAFPLSLSLQAGTASPPVYGQLYEAGATDPPGAGSNVRAQLGFGPPSANPQWQAAWTWSTAVFNTQLGNNDEYQATFTAPAAGSWRYVYRFSLDAGVSWTVCDTSQGDGGAGSNFGLTFDLANQGVLTTTP